MRKILIGILLSLLLISSVAAQDTPVALETFTDEIYGFESVKPEGWTAAGPGIYGRAVGTQDVTLMGQQAAPVSVQQIWPGLLPQLMLTEIPESTGQYESAALTWDLYQVDVTAGTITVKIDLALAAGEGKTYIVLLQAAPDEYESLHEQVFLPTLEAFTPVVIETGDLPYIQEEVTFENGDITLAGTLTLPEGDGPHPAVVLITGSGGQDRDETIFSMRPFKLIADGLTPAGIAVLRYDDRGIGQSTGDFASATTSDFATDAAAAIEYLLTRDDINPEQIGVLGHSEGGIVSAMLGATNPHLAFIISMAGTSVNGRDVLTLQNELILRASGASEEVIALQLEFLTRMFAAIEAGDRDDLIEAAYETVLAQVQTLPEEDREALGDLEAYARTTAEQGAQTYFSDWFREFLNYDPAVDWAKTTVPVLALFGAKDVQVDAGQNSVPLQAALEAAGNTDVTIVTLADANHLFQAADTGGTDEYGTLEPVFVEDFLPTIIDWLSTRVDLTTG